VEHGVEGFFFTVRKIAGGATQYFSESVPDLLDIMRAPNDCNGLLQWLAVESDDERIQALAKSKGLLSKVDGDAAKADKAAKAKAKTETKAAGEKGGAASGSSEFCKGLAGALKPVDDDPAAKQAALAAREAAARKAILAARGTRKSDQAKRKAKLRERKEVQRAGGGD
jgi:hypothetical protein